jgi:hypothetical protein
MIYMPAGKMLMKFSKKFDKYSETSENQPAQGPKNWPADLEGWPVL